MGKSKPPSASERKACWAARDAYFACLDANHLWIQGLAPSTYDEMVAVDPLHLSPLPDNYSNRKLYTCRALKKMFDSDCLASWASHFSMLRVKELQTQELRKKMQSEEQARNVDKDDAFWTRAQQKPNNNTHTKA